MKLTIVDKTSNGLKTKSKEIEVDENLLGVMNHRDLTVDYKQGRKIARLTLTQDGFDDLIQYFKDIKAERREESTEGAPETSEDAPEEQNDPKDD